MSKSQQSPVVDPVLDTTNTGPEVIDLAANRSKARKSHKERIVAMVAALCGTFGIDPSWIKKGLGSNGLAKLATYFEKANIEDMVAFCATTTTTDVIENLLPELLAAEEAAAAEAKPARVIITCTCRNCNDDPKRALRGREGEFRFPKAHVAAEILGRPATSDDLATLAVHKEHDWVEYRAGDHVWYLQAKAGMEAAEAAQEAYDTQKTRAETHFEGSKSLFYASELGYWVQINRGQDAVVLLAHEALVPEKRFVMGKSREPFSPALLARFSVPRWSDTRYYQRMGVELWPLDEALGSAFPTNFPQFVDQEG